MFSSKSYLALCLSFLLITLLTLITRQSELKRWFAGVDSVLHYVIYKPRSPLTLDLFEAERYEPAIVVQSLIGNLVYYSNMGRYEPRLATRWKRVEPHIWKFDVATGYATEDGEVITPAGFKKSIERSLAVLSKRNPFPIMMYLKGYDKFVRSGGQIDGIVVDGSTISFVFDRPVRDGLLQILSFAPFGYIAADNFREDGTWKDKLRFISSGPYKVSKFDLGTKAVLDVNPGWAGPFADDAPRTLRFTYDLPSTFADDKVWIVDAFTAEIQVPEDLGRYALVPEYINPVLLGSEPGKYFASLQTREAFKGLIEKHRAALPENMGAHTRSKRFYPTPDGGSRTPAPPTALPAHAGPLVIEGRPPEPGTPREIAWRVLEAALKEAKLNYRFAMNETTMSSLRNRDYDLRIRGASTGGGPEAWGLNILFCSELGPQFPDPSGRVCQSILDYEADKISDAAFADRFTQAVHEDAAIIPITHYGIQLYLSSRIKRETLNPTISVMRFDQLGVD